MTKNTNTHFVLELLKNKKSFLTIFVFTASSLMTFEVVAKDADIEEEKIAEHRRPQGASPQSSAVTGASNAVTTSSANGHGLYFPGYVVPANDFGYAGSTATLVVPITDSPVRTILISPSHPAPTAVTSSAIDNTGFGHEVFNALTTGTQNVAVGSTAFNDATTGSNNVAVGYSALGAVTTGGQNVGIGTNAGNAILTTSNSTAVGYNALLLNTGASNTAVGSGALDANVAGTPNTAVGLNALGTNVCGNNNVAVGASAGLALLTNQNTAVGSSALAAACGADCTAVGYNALTVNTGASNTAVGSGALDANVAGTPNTAVGLNALGTNISGNNCTAVGAGALALSTGNNCTALGSGAGAVTTGTDNVFVGFNAGSTATTGSNNIFIGSGVTPPVGVTDTATTVIGNGSTARCYIRGIRGVTTVTNDAIAVLIDSNGNLGTASSSRRFKENIVTMDQATAEKLADLNIVTFSYISDATHKVQYGAIAEEVFEIFPELVVNNKDGEIETIQYHHFVPLLIKYAQVQNKEVQSLKAVVAALMKRVEALENK